MSGTPMHINPLRDALGGAGIFLRPSASWVLSVLALRLQPIAQSTIASIPAFLLLFWKSALAADCPALTTK